ncbi:hypothetical protein YC2023_094598 [Brassica napus]
MSNWSGSSSTSGGRTRVGLLLGVSVRAGPRIGKARSKKKSGHFLKKTKYGMVPTCRQTYVLLKGVIAHLQIQSEPLPPILSMSPCGSKEGKTI